jgi:hypothetical protein
VGTLYEDHIHFWSSLAKFFLFGEMFQTKVVEKIKTCSIINNFFFPRKSFRLWDNVEKYFSTGHIWQYGEWALHAGYLRLYTHTHNMQHLLIFHRNNGLHERVSMLPYKYVACLIIYHCQPHSYRLFISDLMKLWTEESDRQAVRRADKRTDTACL